MGTRKWAIWSPSLRDKLGDSDYLLLKIPIEINLSRRGPQGIRMDPCRQSDMLGLSAQETERLRQAGQVLLPHSAQ